MQLNPDMETLLASLQRQHRAALEQAAAAADLSVARALLREGQEILHRMNIAQNLVLEAAVKSLAAEMQVVMDADRQLTREIGALGTVASVVAAFTRYLSAVDTVLDLAKGLLV